MRYRIGELGDNKGNNNRTIKQKGRPEVHANHIVWAEQIPYGSRKVPNNDGYCIVSHPLVFGVLIAR